MDMIQVMAGELADMRDERDRLKLENHILRRELWCRFTLDFMENYSMDEQVAGKAADREITQIIAYNKGAE